MEDRFGKIALVTAKEYGNQSVANEIMNYRDKANRKSKVIKKEKTLPVDESSKKTDKSCQVENELNSALKMSKNEFIKV